jgi:hypothetical protein
MSDLNAGRYPQSHALQAFFGATAESSQANLPIRSNLEFSVYSGPLVDTASLGGTTSGAYVAVPVPVDVGATYSTVSIMVGATAASTPTHGFAALYSGMAVPVAPVLLPQLIAQSADQTTAAMPAKTRFHYALTTPVTVTPDMAPYKYLYVAIVSTATTTVPSCITVPCGAAATQYRWFTGTPLYFSQTATAATSTAPATLVETGVLAVAPIVALW